MESCWEPWNLTSPQCETLHLWHTECKRLRDRALLWLWPRWEFKALQRRCFVTWLILNSVTCHWNWRLSEGDVISQLITQLWNRFSFGWCILSNWIYFPLILLPFIYLWIEASKEKLLEKSFCGECWQKNYSNLIVKCWKMIYLLFRNTTNGPCLLNPEIQTFSCTSLGHSPLIMLHIYGIICDMLPWCINPEVPKIYGVWLNSENKLKMLFNIIHGNLCSFWF